MALAVLRSLVSDDKKSTVATSFDDQHSNLWVLLKGLYNSLAPVRGVSNLVGLLLLEDQWVLRKS